MAKPVSDTLFAGSIPQLYDTLLVPLIFQPYADDLAKRLASRSLERVLEVAAGTGVVTRTMASTLPPRVSITATDLNQPMLDHAAAIGTLRPVQWRRADALQLPFADQSFDAVVCQFGAMFFPDKVQAFAEARRVLRRAGVLLFNVWDRIDNNDFANVVNATLKDMFPSDPPLFLRRTPYGYFDTATIRSDLANGGFGEPAEVSTVAARSRAASPRLPAEAFCRGTPLLNEITARDPARIDEAVDKTGKAIAARFGNGPVEGRIQAVVVAVER